jgi:hypothetical protein
MRFRRRKITGFDEGDGWEVNEAGVIYHHCRIQEPTKDIAALPTIDLGHRYAGPVKPPGRPSTLRLVDEVVCFEFHGEPAGGWHWSYVKHLDGDDLNCAAANLAWATYEKEKAYTFHVALMRPDNLPAHRVVRGTLGRFSNRPMLKRPMFVSSASVPGHLPVTAQRIGA